MEKLVIIGTHGEENPEKAILPFVMACTATASNMDPVMILQGPGVWLARKGYAKTISVSSFPPLDELLEAFQESKGRILVCAPCLKKRNIQPEDLVEGAVVINAPTVIKEIGEAKAVLSY
ncbi:MAG TPA: DsrE family protein [Methanomassiliicoccales archaeon]|nr:DsrE family protein [Methanomassiliicoccales archaeon]